MSETMGYNTMKNSVDPPWYVSRIRVPALLYRSLLPIHISSQNLVFTTSIPPTRHPNPPGIPASVPSRPSRSRTCFHRMFLPISIAMSEAKRKQHGKQVGVEGKGTTQPRFHQMATRVQIPSAIAKLRIRGSLDRWAARRFALPHGP